MKYTSCVDLESFSKYGIDGSSYVFSKFNAERSATFDISIGVRALRVRYFPYTRVSPPLWFQAFERLGEFRLRI